MFILCGPYNSSLLGKSLREIREPVLVLPRTNVPFNGSYNVCEVDSNEIISSSDKILSSLEESIPFLTNHFSEHNSVKIANIFKDKFLFRETLKSNGLHKNFEFTKIDSPILIEAKDINFKPKVLKPTHGISSKGVCVLKDLKSNLYVSEASESNPYLLEDYIPGIELAVDGYYDSHGEPVVFNILQHDFSNGLDVSDTFYWSNINLIKEHVNNITSLLINIKSVFPKLRNFPFHLECRVNQLTKEYIPIEINPLRFAGYGTCEIMHYAYDINPYSSFFAGKKPDWFEKIKTFSNNDKDSYYGFVCINKEIPHRELHDMFDEVLEYRFIPVDSDAKVIVLFRTKDLESLKSKILKP